MLSWKFLPNWRLAVSNFYPISMVNVSKNGQPGAVIMVASAEQVVSLSVPNIDRTLGEVDLPAIFTSCDPEHCDPLRDLKTSGTNVISVTSDGQLMVHDTTKDRFVAIEPYNHSLLHAEQGPTNGELFIVRQTNNGQIVLEVIEIFAGCTTHAALKSYELVTESIHAGARFSIRSVTVNEANQRFWSDFLGFIKLSIADQVLLVAINNTLYWLKEHLDSGDSDLIAVRCFASVVLDFDFSEGNHCLTVLLQAGVLVVFSQSQDPDALLVSSTFSYLHAPVEAHAFDRANNAFLYSNGLCTYRVHCHYSVETKQIATEVEEIPIRGVIAITLLESKSVALLLTENNQFYSLDRAGSGQKQAVSTSTKFVLEKNMRSVSKRLTKRLTDEIRFDKRLEEAIQVEQAKFDILALYRNRTVFKGLSRMDIVFHSEMPSKHARTLAIGKQTGTVCIFVSVKIEINLGFFKLLSGQKCWFVCIEYNDHFTTHSVHETFSSDGALHAIIFLCKRELTNGLPNVRSWLLASVQHGQENLLLTIAVPPSTNTTEASAVRLIQTAESSVLPSRRRTLQRAACDVIAQNNPPLTVRRSFEAPLLTYCIRNEHSKAKAVSFSTALESNAHVDTWSVLDEQISISWHGEQRAAIVLKAFCPVAMALVKRFLLDPEEYAGEMERRRDKLKGFLLELQAVGDAALIAQLYQRVRSDNAIEDDAPLSFPGSS
uniref:Uncharacterized protein n=1 Tax=Anopheles dirus TaxID=7168 RepID=A0A182NAT0_9DIPT